MITKQVVARGLAVLLIVLYSILVARATSTSLWMVFLTLAFLLFMVALIAWIVKNV